MAELTKDQEAELRRLLEPRPPSYSGLEGIPNEVGMQGRQGPARLEPESPIPIERSYRMTQDPYLQASAQGDRQAVVEGLNLGLQGPDPFQVRSPALNRTGLQGWDDDPSRGGLGLAGQGPSAQPGMRPQGMLPEDILARKLYGEDVQLGWGDRVRLRMAMANGGVMQLAGRQDQIAMQAQQLAEQKQQHMFERVRDIDKEFAASPEKWQSAMENEVAGGNPFARTMLQSGGKQMAGDFVAVADTAQKLYPDIVKQYQQNPSSVSPATMKHVLKSAHDYIDGERKATLEDVAKQQRVQGLLDRFKQDPNTLSDTDLDLVDKYYKGQEERKLKIQELRSKLESESTTREHTKAQTNMLSAPREMASGVLNDQGQVFTDIFNPKTGKTERVVGQPLQRTQDMTASATEKVVEARAVLEQIAELDKKFNADYVGPFDNIKAWAKETAPGVFGPISGQEEKFRKVHNQIVTNARRLDAGTAQSVQELTQLAKTYPDLAQHESVYQPALEAMRERITSGLKARSRLAAEIAAGKQRPISLTDRAAQLANLVSAPGFAKDADEAKKIAQDILREEMKLGIVKAD